MALALAPGANWRIRRLSPGWPYALARTALIVGIGVQLARLFWVAVMPLGPVGDWRAASPLPSANAALLSQVDPFFRLQPVAGTVAVTSLPLKLFGVRLDQATGAGSAIIATPDGTQSSFVVGDTVMPGVILKGIAIDSVTIDRGGALEQIFLDQSVAPRAVVAGVPAPSLPGALSARSDIDFAPRIEGGQVTGFTVSPRGTGDAFRASGLQTGDVVTQVNGAVVRTPDEAATAIASSPATGIVTVTVERGGRTITVNLQGPRQ